VGAPPPGYPLGDGEALSGHSARLSGQIEVVPCPRRRGRRTGFPSSFAHRRPVPAQAGTAQLQSDGVQPVGGGTGTCHAVPAQAGTAQARDKHMPHAHARLFYHFVWSTWDRVALLEGEIERHAYALIREQCGKMDCTLHAIGGTVDHVHLLATLPRALCIADFAEAVKGCSSRALNEAHQSDTWVFKWQGGYGVVTVSPGHVRRVIRYVENQKQHHADGTIWHSLEESHDDT
jgi:putative transposase